MAMRKQAMPGRILRRLAVLFAAMGGVCMAGTHLCLAAPAEQSPEAIVQRMRATYAALQAYSDTGTVLHEYGASAKDRHTFTTYFNRSPRAFAVAPQKPPQCS